MNCYILKCHKDMQVNNLGLLLVLTLSSKIPPIENKFQMGLHYSAISAGGCKSFFGFALAVKPIWWYPYLRSREEKILQLCNFASVSVMVSRWQDKITVFPLCVH